MDIDAFLQDLASGDPVPGGGTAAALEVALGASLLAMVCALTMGRPKFAAVTDEVESIRERAVGYRDQARRLMDIDAEAYGAVATAMRLPRTSREERDVRRDAVEASLQGAAQAPLQTMEVAVRALDLALRLVTIGNPSVISDTGTAALALHAGFRAARLNVEINLASIRDATFHDHVRAAIAALPDADARRDAIMEKVDGALGAHG